MSADCSSLQSEHILPLHSQPPFTDSLVKIGATGKEASFQAVALAPTYCIAPLRFKELN